MATRARVTIPLLFLLGTSLLFAAAVSASHDEEDDRRGGHSLQQCVQRCQQDRPRYSHARCVQECRDDQQQHGRHEQEEQGRGHGRHGEGGREEEQGRGRGRHGQGEREEEQGRGRGRRGEGERDEEHGDSRRPYVFGPRSFRSIIRSDHGFVKALRPFDEVSRLLRGIRNYRVAIMEVNPRAFVVPGLTDADGVGYVAQGEGVLTVIENGEKRSYTVREGDVIVAPAGSIMHLANTDGRRKLIIAKILHTISVPGMFQYFSAKPLLASLSKRVLRAALKTSDERLERLLDPRQGQEKTGGSMSIVRASEEQLHELSRQASEGSQGHHWPLPPFRGDSRDTYNLLEQRPKIANRHGRLYEADARSFHALAQHDVRVAVANITPVRFYDRAVLEHPVVQARRRAGRRGRGADRVPAPRPRQRAPRARQGQVERGRGRRPAAATPTRVRLRVRVRVGGAAGSAEIPDHPREGVTRLGVRGAPRPPGGGDRLVPRQQQPPGGVLRDQRRAEREGVARREEQRDRQAGQPRPGAHVRQARQGGAGGVPRQGSAGRGLRRRSRAAGAGARGPPPW
uniref:Cupin type-1 domain-containing protein n=1 Tax=Aegilops tauschii subsp. strangulata TaxID=200361 RepID=A0A453H1F5_AEGTS